MSKIFLFIIAVALVGCSGNKAVTLSSNSNSVAREVSEFDNKLFEAMTQMSLGNLDKAYGFYQECAEIDPSQALPFYEMARLDIKRQNIAQAISNGETAVNIEQNNEWYHATLALAYKEKADFTKAITHYQKAAELNPKNREYYRKIIKINLMAGDRKKALDYLDVLEAKIGVTEEVSFEKYDIYLSMDNYSDAEKELNKLIENFPNEVRYRGVLAEMFASKGEIEKALEQFEIMRNMDPENGLLHWQLAQHYSSLGDEKNTYEEFKKAFVSTEVSLGQKVAVVETYIEHLDHKPTDVEKVENLLNILSDAHPNNSKVLFLKGDYYFGSYQFNEALEEYLQAFELDQSSQELLMKIVKLEYTLGEGNKLVASGTRGTELFPVQPVFYLFKSLGEVSLGNYDEALRTLQVGKEYIISNDNLKALFYEQMGLASYSKNDILNAKKFYDKALGLDVHLMEVENGNILFHIYMEKYDEANVLLNGPILFNPLNKTGLKPSKAHYLFKTNKLEESEALYKSFITNSQERNSLMMEHYGDLLKAMGKDAEAVKVWQEVYDKASKPSLLEKIKEE